MFAIFININAWIKSVAIYSKFAVCHITPSEVNCWFDYRFFYKPFYLVENIGELIQKERYGT